MQTVSPERAVELVNSGAVLIDIREAAEHANENIPGARHHALSQIDAQHPVRAGDTVLIFHCKSGARTNMNAQRLSAAAGDCEVYLLGGGIEGWKRAGLPTSATGNDTAGANQGGFLSRLTALFR
jgi:rhodanese-related sulfurtransferase